MDKTEEWRAIGLLDYIRDYCENNNGLYDKTHLVNKISKAMDEYTQQVSKDEKKHDSFWFDIFNERYPDEVKEIMDSDIYSNRQNQQ